MKKTIEDIAEEMAEVFTKNDGKLVRCWNFLFEEEQIKKDMIEDSSIKEEIVEEIFEEVLNFSNPELIEEVYIFTTGNSFPEIVTEDLDYTDWNDDWEE